MCVLEGARLLPARLHLWPRKLPGLPGTLGGSFLVAGTDSVNTEDGASASGWEIGIGLSHRTRGVSAPWCPPTPAAPISLATRLLLRWPVGCRCPGAYVRAVTALRGAPSWRRLVLPWGQFPRTGMTCPGHPPPFLCLPYGQGVMDTQSHKRWREQPRTSSPSERRAGDRCCTVTFYCVSLLLDGCRFGGCVAECKSCPAPSFTNCGCQ